MIIQPDGIARAITGSSRRRAFEDGIDDRLGPLTLHAMPDAGKDVAGIPGRKVALLAPGGLKQRRAVVGPVEEGGRDGDLRRICEARF
jgi:hypothetical protein